MDLLELKYFLETAKTGNMTHAAQNLHISQPALSKQIRHLEDELCQPLFIRTLHQVRLTRAGEQLMIRAEEILALTNQTVSELSLVKGDLSGELNIGVVSNGITPNIARVFGNFAKEHPHLRCNAHNGSLDVIRSLLEHKVVDVALMFKSDYTEGLRYMDLNTKRSLGIVLQDSDPLTKHIALKATSLKKLPIIGPVEGSNFTVLNHLPFPYEELNIVATFDDPSDYMEFLRYSAGYMLCLEPRRPMYPDSGLCFLPLDPRIEAKTCLVSLDTALNNKAVDALFEYFRIWMRL